MCNCANRCCCNNTVNEAVGLGVLMAIIAIPIGITWGFIWLGESLFGSSKG
jgi:hypothetical protein